MTTPTKEELLQTLTTFVRQKPGFDPANYNDMASYRADVRPVTKDLHAFNELASFCALHDVDVIKAISFARNRGLHYGRKPGAWDYDEGQFRQTEYRRAACNYLAHAISEYFRGNGAPTVAEIIKAARRNFSARTVKRFF